MKKTIRTAFFLLACLSFAGPDNVLAKSNHSHPGQADAAPLN